MIYSILRVFSKQQGNDAFGTAFVIHHDSESTYLATCSHVIKDVGGMEFVKIGNLDLELIVDGGQLGIDIAILQTRVLLSIPSLDIGSKVQNSDTGLIGGYRSYIPKNQTFLMRPIKCKVGYAVSLEAGTDKKVKAWDILIEDQNTLQPGYSGSPVVSQITNKVIGIIAHREGEGKKGLALSLESIIDIWDEIPLALKNSILNDDGCVSKTGIYTDISQNLIPDTAFANNKIELENKSKLDRLSFGLSLDNQDQDVLDGNHVYEILKRIDVLDTMNGKYTSHRWLTIRNVSKKPTYFVPHQESGENKIRFEDMNFKAYLNNRDGLLLHVKSLIKIQPSFVQKVHIMFPKALQENELITLYYRISWPDEPKVYSGDEHSQSISLVRYLKGVKRLDFGVVDLVTLTPAKHVIGIVNSFAEEELETLPINFKVEDEIELSPIHNKGYQGVLYSFDPVEHISYRYFYCLAMPQKLTNNDEF